MNTHNLKASIIVPVYMAEKYIAKCIESVLLQTETAFELILILDGEFDKSGEICRSYERKDNRVKVINKMKEGVSIARNIGMEHAKGDWVVFLDSDDWIEVKCLSKMIDLATNNNADIAICSYYTEFQNESKKDSFFTFSAHCFKKAEKVELIKNCLICTGFGNPCASTNVGVPWAKIYKREFLQKNEIKFVPNLVRMQDAVFNLYTFSLATKIVYEDVALYHYTKHVNSATIKYRKDFYDIATMFISEVRKFICWSELYEVEETLNVKIIHLLLETIMLQFVPRESTLSFIQKMKMINKIIRGEEIRGALLKVNRNYLTKRQAIAVYLLKLKLSPAIYFYLKIKRRMRHKCWKE